MTETVCIVDDDAAVRRSLSRLLLAERIETRVFDSAEDFLTSQPASDVACLLLDVNMPGMSGMELQRRLTERGDDVPIVFLTGHGDIAMSVEAMKRGALDFLTKPVDQADLLRAVRRAIEHHRRTRDEASVREAIEERLANLTTREYEVMHELLTGAANKTVADRLGISVKTVKVHRSHVMEKMQVRSVAELVHLYHLAGLD